MKLNTVYTTFNGEVNKYGIGSNCIFLRLQGCHLRCYKKTLGVLCDTPEGLEKSSTSDDIFHIFEVLESESLRTGLKLVTLTGGDPLWNKPSDVRALLLLMVNNGYEVSVETSGTLSWLNYRDIENVHWVIDYKAHSTGVEQSRNLLLNSEHLMSLNEDDYIKFVIYDEKDYEEFHIAINQYIELGVKAKISVGAYWGGKLEPLQLFELIKKDNLLPYCSMNFQVHKMAVSSVYDREIPKEI